ncbi:hypothetical protein ACHAWF_004399 [Thalassiosira exigua]
MTTMANNAGRRAPSDPRRAMQSQSMRQSSVPNMGANARGGRGLAAMGPGAGSQRTLHNSQSNSMRFSTSATRNPPWFDANNAQPRNERPREMPEHKEVNDDDDRTMLTMSTMATRDQAFKRGALNKAKHLVPPSGDVTIIYTDVQGSTSLWESCPSDMKKAQDIHDDIMRKCYTNHGGYEITTEGDAFNLAFQHPADALAFALQAQIKLYKANWPQGILNHPDGKNDPNLKFRGFRVRFGIHHGPINCQIHEATGRMAYSGEGVKVAKVCSELLGPVCTNPSFLCSLRHVHNALTNIQKAVEGMCHGGQILATMETWKAVSGMAERYLGRPQILDCGEHFLFETTIQTGAQHTTTTRYTRRIIQLVPSELAFDFFEARGRQEARAQDGKVVLQLKDASSVKGRLFPPIISKRQLTTSFLNAPYMNGRVTICFVYTVGLRDDDPARRARNLGVLGKHVRGRLLGMKPPGYECQEDKGCWMLAFDRMVNAVFFGLQLKTALNGVKGLVGNVDVNNMFKVGILSGPFTSMGPHKTTGMADYFGPIVNRAARVASNCKPGQVCVGTVLSPGVTTDPPDFGPQVSVRLQEIKKLKGITIDVAIFDCSVRRAGNRQREAKGNK